MSQGAGSTFGAALRQWLQPAEFRIDHPALPAQAWGAVEQWAQQLARQPVEPRGDPPGHEAGQRERVRFLADLATGLWRLRKRMLEPGTDRPKEAYRREYSHLESVWDLLAGAGVKVIDHTGRPFDPGQRLEVAGQITTPGLLRPRVQETVRPTVYVDDEHVQCGVVLVENPPPA